MTTPKTTPPTRLLVVEDEHGLTTNIAEYFESSDYCLDFAADGLTALHLLAHHSYDLIILDLMLPGVSGQEICRRIRQDLNSQVAIIITTARDGLSEKEDCFHQGADDYLVKPFNLRELELRIQAIMRRGQSQSRLIEVGPVAYNPALLQVQLYNHWPVSLSGFAANLFEALIRAYPDYLDHHTLSEMLWASDEIDPHTLRTHIYNLRRRLENQFGHSLIETVYGRGYRLAPPADSGVET